MYAFLRKFVVFCLRNFFRSIRIDGAPPVTNGAVIIVPNHPNHMLDPLLMVYTYERSLWFLAKATLFRIGIIGKILRALHLVPVYRKHDDPKETSKNKETFKFVEDALMRERAIVLFPEGVSMGERKLYPIKTGAARMAFQTEAAKDFTLGLVIQPVGITYTDLRGYRSSVTITVGEPIKISAWRERFLRDEFSAARELTESIEAAIRDLSVEMRTEEFKHLAEKIAALYEPISNERNDTSRLREIAQQVEALAPRFPEKAREIENSIDTFLALGESLGLRARELTRKSLPRAQLAFFSPFLIWGSIFHYVPYRMVEPIASKLSSHPADTASRKFSTGVVVFLFWYALWFLLGLHFELGVWSTLLACSITVVSGMLCHRYLEEAKLLLLSMLWPGKKSPIEILVMMRDDLVRELERLRER